MPSHASDYSVWAVKRLFTLKNVWQKDLTEIQNVLTQKNYETKKMNSKKKKKKDKRSVWSSDVQLYKCDSKKKKKKGF